MVPRDQLHGEIDERLAIGQALLAQNGQRLTYELLQQCKDEYRSWDEYNVVLVRRSFDLSGPADDYSRSAGVFVGGALTPQEQWSDLMEDIQKKCRRLKSLQERLGLYQEHRDVVSPAPPPGDLAVLGTDVFVVHGHDGETKQTVARFLTKLTGKDPIILHEQADKGRTIIEKFEDHAATAACAVALLTGDDVGGPKVATSTSVPGRTSCWRPGSSSESWAGRASSSSTSRG